MLSSQLWYVCTCVCMHVCDYHVYVWFMLCSSMREAAVNHMLRGPHIHLQEPGQLLPQTHSTCVQLMTYMHICRSSPPMCARAPATATLSEPQALWPPHRSFLWWSLSSAHLRHTHSLKHKNIVSKDWVYVVWTTMSALLHMHIPKGIPLVCGAEECCFPVLHAYTHTCRVIWFMWLYYVWFI